MKKNIHLFRRMYALILASALLIQQTCVCYAAASTTEKENYDTGEVYGPPVPKEMLTNYLSDKDLKEICQKYNMDLGSKSVSTDKLIKNTLSEMSGLFDKNSLKPVVSNETAQQLKQGIISSLSGEYGQAKYVIGFNASGYGLNLDMLNEGGIQGIIERYNSPADPTTFIRSDSGSMLPSSLTTKNRTLFESLTKNDQAKFYAFDELGSEVSKLKGDHNELLHMRDQAKWYKDPYKEVQYSSNTPTSEKIRLSKKSSDSAELRLNNEKTKWYKTGGHLLVRAVNIIMGSYTLYNEAGNIGELTGEYENMKDDDPAASWLGRAGLSISAVASGIMAIGSGISGSVADITLFEIGSTTGGFLGTLAGAVAITAATIGAAWLVTTDEFKDHTSDWTWHNIKHTAKSFFDIARGNITDENAFLYDEMAKEWEEYPWKQNLDEGIQEIYYFFDDLFYGENSERNKIKPAPGIGALKPNIYIYPESEQDVTVTFGMPQWLTKSIPDYSESWKVSVAPDGTITTPDGSTFGYLFYESETQPYYFDKDEGWMIPADTRAERFREILTAYGFNENEIRDFLEFWTIKLPDRTDVMMYPQLTETVDNAMPVSISPAPDHIFRLWFTFEPFDGQTVPEPEIKPVSRDGYTVVEWGGVILSE
ncbi:hypothetical protein UYO_0772 [Lachnospiraceae bacterium JC7]|nr:hypothetical protein UYO_0772 [Lachnospiraceae bacterium JC7]